jgi:squalene-hopene/tetraprenyl-beta-curcumene cyclase
MSDEVNEMAYADGSDQGGFIYATVENIESVDGLAGQSMAGTTTETTADGTELVRLRAYGSMTYAGFKSLLYANLDRDDPRIVDAWKWIENNYTLEENPGMGNQGYYYYLCTMARALDAMGIEEINGRNWREDMIDKIFELQFVSGAFRTLDARWMENNDVLIAAYALIAVQHALR